MIVEESDRERPSERDYVYYSMHKRYVPTRKNSLFIYQLLFFKRHILFFKYYKKEEKTQKFDNIHDESLRF